MFFFLPNVRIEIGVVQSLAQWAGLVISGLGCVAGQTTDVHLQWHTVLSDLGAWGRVCAPMLVWHSGGTLQSELGTSLTVVLALV